MTDDIFGRKWKKTDFEDVNPTERSDTLRRLKLGKFKALPIIAGLLNFMQRPATRQLQRPLSAFSFSFSSSFLIFRRSPTTGTRLVSTFSDCHVGSNAPVFHFSTLTSPTTGRVSNFLFNRHFSSSARSNFYFNRPMPSTTTAMSNCLSSHSAPSSLFTLSRSQVFGSPLQMRHIGYVAHSYKIPAVLKKRRLGKPYMASHKRDVVVEKVRLETMARWLPSAKGMVFTDLHFHILFLMTGQ